MRLKHGVDVTKVQPAIWYAAGICEMIYKRYNKIFTITSLRDGVHMTGSRHYSGYAMDLRTRHLDQAVGDLIFAEIVYRLRPLGFDFKDERKMKSHFHIEYDPKPDESLTSYVA